jgi:hypothetical protein
MSQQRSQRCPRRDDETSRLIGRDNTGKVTHLDVSHTELSERYRDTLADWTKSQFTPRQLDAFHLYMYSSDLQYIYDKYASCVQCIGDIQVIRFRGKYYRFDNGAH